MTIDIRQSWEAHIDLQHTLVLVFREAEHQLFQSEYNDYGIRNRRILVCFRSAVISALGCSLKSRNMHEFYTRRYKSSAPLHGWLQRIYNKQITIDGCVVTDPDAVIREGAELVYHRLPWKEPDAPYLLEILYEDNDVIALNKPSGLQVLPGGLFQQRTVFTQLQQQAGNLEESGCQEPHPVPVHRLGRVNLGSATLCQNKAR